MLDAVRFHLLGIGADPYARQQAAADERDRWARRIRDRLDPLRRRIFDVMPAADQAQTGATISGVAASGGRVTAPGRVVDGPGGFAALQPGEVLVARITTPAWTPLFTRAAAVVTDVGGPLSHSSIVAREYGIPAVLGTGSATGRIRTGQRLLVDGDRGTVTLLDDDTAG